MKLHGKKLDAPNNVIIPIPRESGDIILMASPILDYSDFEKMCPEPEPREMLKPGGVREIMFNDPEFLKARVEWGEKRTAWISITSLSATEGLEWENVQLGDPDTWSGWCDELKAGGITDFEISRIINAIFTANGFNQEKIDEALANFLAGREKAQKSESSPITGQ